MRAITTHALILLLFISCNSSITHQANNTGLQFENDTLRFEVPKNKSLGGQQIKLINTGTLPERIISATATCSCIITDFEKKNIAPGESGIISFHVTLNNNKAGVTEEKIAIRTSSESSPLKFLVLQVKSL
jgi:Protein of unknown function (DUF1573)